MKYIVASVRTQILPKDGHSIHCVYGPESKEKVVEYLKFYKEAKELAQKIHRYKIHDDTYKEYQAMSTDFYQYMHPTLYITKAEIYGSLVGDESSLNIIPCFSVEEALNEFPI